MKLLAYSYPIIAFLAVLFWITLLPPLNALLLGDGSSWLLFGLGVLSISLLQLILWSASGIRELTAKVIGNAISTTSASIVFFNTAIGIYFLVQIYINGL